MLRTLPILASQYRPLRQHALERGDEGLHRQCREDEAPSIALPEAQHKAVKSANTRGRYSGTARDLLAKGIRDLRRYTNAPNSSLCSLIERTKQEYGGQFEKDQPESRRNMDQKEFVRIVIQNVLDVAVRSTRKVLTAPPGRHPTPEALSLSRWYAGLSESDKNFLNRAIRETADAAVFGFLCLLDGARSVGDGKAGTFQLSYLADDAEFPICPGEEDLHDIYSSMMSDQRRETSASNQPTKDF